MAVAVPARRTSSWGYAAALLGSLLLAGIVLRTFDPSRIAGVQNFFLISGSLLIEAIPFVLLGAVVSAAIEVFVPVRVFERLAGLPRPLQLPAAGVAGMAFPVCECGSVPVARRLAAKGLSPAAAVTFMLAAPVLNPVVVVSTVVAYRGRETLWPMVLGRVGLGMVAAIAVGWVFSAKRPGELLRGRPAQERDDLRDHDSRPAAFFGHLASDFVFMARYLVIGALVAALLQTLVPQSLIGSVADAPVVSLVAMMALAFVLSLCSESDAFVAASFVQFGVGAQLAFLVFGPMVDTKLGVLYSATFTRGFVRTVALVVGVVVLAGTLWLEVLIG
jgi:uncharacterized membrane protein YraQ (UPF0718 family)